MPKVNLLPSDLVPKKSVLRLASTLKRIVYAGIAVFFVLLLTITSIFLIDYYEIRNLKTEQETLVADIKKNEQTEQLVVLAKDRMSKIKKIWRDNTVSQSLEAFEKLLPQVTGRVSLGNCEIESSKSEITVVGNSSLDISRFMSFLVSSDIYKTIRLKNFTFNPNYGYRVNFEGYIK